MAMPMIPKSSSNVLGRSVDQRIRGLGKTKRIASPPHSSSLPPGSRIIPVSDDTQHGINAVLVLVYNIPFGSPWLQIKPHKRPQIAPRGFEPLGPNSQSPTDKALTKNSNSVLSTGLDNLVQEFPDLVQLVKAWPDLPEDTRKAIRTLIGKHSKEG